MRKKEREITDKKDLIDIFEKADVCRIAINDDVAPYIVPLSFGYIWKEHIQIFFHCATEGQKLELLSKNNTVCFEMDIEHKLVRNENPCNWGMKYKSIIGFGKITEVKDNCERKLAFNKIMEHYGLIKEQIDYNETILNKTKILRLDVIALTGKQNI